MNLSSRRMQLQSQYSNSENLKALNCTPKQEYRKPQQNQPRFDTLSATLHAPFRSPKP